MPSINWDHVHPSFEWLAINADGTACLFRFEPVPHADEWRSSHCTGRDVKLFASLKPGNVPWNKSLVRRPEGDS